MNHKSASWRCRNFMCLKMDSKNRIDWLKPRDKSSSISAADGFAHSPNRLPIVHDCFLSQSVLRNMPNCSPQASQREPSSEANKWKFTLKRTLVMRQFCTTCILAFKKSSEGKTDGEVERLKLIKFAPEVSVKFTHGRNSCANLYATRPPRACACPAIACNAPRLTRCWFSKMQNLHKSSCSYAKLCCWGISSYLSTTYPATTVQHVSYPKLMSFFFLQIFSAGIAHGEVKPQWRPGSLKDSRHRLPAQ